ncbi:hypothetical protein niasHT_029042 [Heterodera trifolii]|uniref:Uncharacterized protein n=1 Tax=Heterodera trifolii TaxID=157864 RepID=A0ABD2KBL9_9BILA
MTDGVCTPIICHRLPPTRGGNCTRPAGIIQQSSAAAAGAAEKKLNCCWVVVVVQHQQQQQQVVGGAKQIIGLLILWGRRRRIEFESPIYPPLSLKMVVGLSPPPSHPSLNVHCISLHLRALIFITFNLNGWMEARGWGRESSTPPARPNFSEKGRAQREEEGRKEDVLLNGHGKRLVWKKMAQML